MLAVALEVSSHTVNPAHRPSSRSVSCWQHKDLWLTCSTEASRIIVEQTKLFKITVSFGSVTSLISLPCFMSHASIPAEVRAARGLPNDLVRISAGIEDDQDLIAGGLTSLVEHAAYGVFKHCMYQHLRKYLCIHQPCPVK